ncbi:hypothetical protein Drorol1_Dr00025012 [Drosera rotundifolia]
MAPLVCSFLILFVVNVCAIPISLSLGGVSFQHSKTNRTGFRIDLHHRDSNMNLTKHELVKRALQREKVRLQKFRAVAKTSSSGAQTPVYSNVGDGEYLMRIAIGSSRSPAIAILDTGSDLIWFQCKPCKPCFSQPSPTFNPKTSSTYKLLPCNNKYCQALPYYVCDSKNYCSYEYGYGGGFDSEGYLSSETFTFKDASFPNIAFGCPTSNEGEFPKADGLIGMGAGPLSFISQFSYGPKIFSYCLGPVGSPEVGSLSLGSFAIALPKNVPSIEVPLHPDSNNPTFYYVSLHGVSVGEAKLSGLSSVFETTGGCILDSGTTLTYVPPQVYQFILDKLATKIPLRPYLYGGSQGLTMCWEHTKNVTFPEIVLYFDNGKKWGIPSSSYLIADTIDKISLICTVLLDSTELGINIIGNYFQQHNVIRYDITKSTVTIAGPTDCSKI